MQVIQNTDICSVNQDKQLIQQQCFLISALKEEIVRLQKQLDRNEREITFYKTQMDKKQMQLEKLNEKVKLISENNQSILQTFQIFQREFIKKDYQNVLDLMQSQNQNEQPDLIKSLMLSIKSKSSKTNSLKSIKRSAIRDYYGYYLESNAEEVQLQLYEELDKTGYRINKLKSYGRKNYFSQNFRHVFWLKSIPNVIVFTEKLFQSIDIKLSTYQVNSILKQDLRRMDVKLPDSEAKLLFEQIQKCLTAFEIYRPDIGYVQGMNYIAWMFVVRMQPYHALTCFSNIILTDPFLSSLYNFDISKITRIMKFYEECLMDKKPKLGKHMKNLGVDADLFLIEWGYTFFARAFNIRIVSKIWDLWFCQGFNVFFKVCMVIIEMLEAELLQQVQNDKIIFIIRSKTMLLNQQEFLRLLLKLKLYQNLVLQ